MRLLLVRHGEALATSNDPPLSPAGIKTIESLAATVQERMPASRILHSHKRRARETATILSRGELFLEEHPHLCPNDSVDFILNEILEETQDLIIVSHLPFLPNLMEKLNVHVIEFRPGTAVALSPRWKIDWVI